jgi:hypothetical protein
MFSQDRFEKGRDKARKFVIDRYFEDYCYNTSEYVT